MYDESGCAKQSDHDNDSGCAHQSDHFDDNDNYNLAPSEFDQYQEDPEFENSGTGIEEDTVMNAYGPERLEYKGLEYSRYELEGFEHPGYEPRRAKFKGTTGGDVKNIENKSQRLRFEPDWETQGRCTHPMSHTFITMFNGGETNEHAMDYPDPTPLCPPTPNDELNRFYHLTLHLLGG